MSDQLLLVRHGLTEWNREGRFQGHRDPRLAPEGRDQVQALARRLAAGEPARPVRIVSSPLGRAFESAEIVAGSLGIAGQAIVRDGRLQELGQGEWEGHTHDELRESNAARYAAWRTGAWDEPPPGGEPVAHAADRVRAGVADAIAAADHDRAWPLCLVAHGGSLRLVAHALLELDVKVAWSLELDNAALCVLDRDPGGWRLVTWNDTGHLLGRSALRPESAEAVF